MLLEIFQVALRPNFYIAYDALLLMVRWHDSKTQLNWLRRHSCL